MWGRGRCIIEIPFTSIYPLLKLNMYYTDDIGTFISYTQSAPTCTSILTFVNIDSGETTVISADVMSSPENITFDPAQLETNSNYNVSVLASNVAGSVVSYTRIQWRRKMTLSGGATAKGNSYQFTFLQIANYKSKINLKI